MILYIYIASGQGLTTPWGQNFDANRNIMSLRSFVTSFKKVSLKSDFIRIYKPRTEADSPQATKFWCQQKCLVTSFICCKFQKKNVFEVWFYTIFHDLIHIYSPRAETDTPHVTKFSCQQKGLITLTICCKFQRNLFEVWFYTILSWFNTCI